MSNKNYSNNIKNLKSLWKLAAISDNCFFQDQAIDFCFKQNREWPNRLWLKEEPTKELLILAKNKLIEIGKNLVIPYWHRSEAKNILFLEKYGLTLLFKQTGMTMSLDGKLVNNNMLYLIKVNTFKNAERWSVMFNAAFGYAIHPETIFKSCHQINYFIATYQDQPVGTVILHALGETAGIHAMGIIPGKRKMGLARQLMLSLLVYARNKGARQAELQASEAGIGLYMQLGFRPHSFIKNYRLSAFE